MPQLLGALGPDGILLELDASRLMLREARRKHTNGRLRYICSDFLAYVKAQPADSLDAIVYFSALPHFEDKQAVLEGFFQALVPRRRLLIIHAASSHEINTFHTTLAPPVNGHRLPNISALRHIAQSTGFTVIDAQDEPGLYRLAA